MLKIVEETSKKISGMQFKALEANGASDLFEEIKELKIKIVTHTIIGQSVSKEKQKIIEIKKLFNEKTMSKIQLLDYQISGIENKYIADFENVFS
jgi:hypothetical protein